MDLVLLQIVETKWTWSCYRFLRQNGPGLVTDCSVKMDLLLLQIVAARWTWSCYRL